MWHQAIRPLALMLVVFLVGAAPVRAASLTFEEVVRAVGANGQLRPADEVRLRHVQSGRAAGQQPQAPTQELSGAQTKTDVAPGGGAPASDPTLSQSGGGQVETVDLGDVTGTVCDCGEVPVAAKVAGGFPWWPFLGVPLICATGVCFDGDEEEECIVNCGPSSTPTPPGNPVPEPATLLLFGSGLLAVGARARRRFGRKGPAAPANAEEV